MPIHANINMITHSYLNGADVFFHYIYISEETFVDQMTDNNKYQLNFS